MMPTAFTTGGKDTAVPPQSVLRLAEKLKQAGHKTLLLHREDGGHATTYEDTRAALEFVLNAAAMKPPSSANAPAALPAPAGDEMPFIVSEAKRLLEKLARLRSGFSPLVEPAKADRFADADVFHKGITWALRYRWVFNCAPQMATTWRFCKRLWLSKTRCTETVQGAVWPE